MRRWRRRLLWAIVIAGAVGFAAGWFARVWTTPTVEDRMRDAAHRIQERARSLSH